MKLEEVFDELQSRFLMNLPRSELSSSERLFFQIEQCYWFYEDFYADHYKHLAHMKLNTFAERMFQHCELLKPLEKHFLKMFQTFRDYQSSIPVVGCILLNSKLDQCVLVRNWKGTSWTFPRGKINQGETDDECAVRESLEECGYDVSGKLDKKQFLEMKQQVQKVKMYIITDVDENYPFAPQTRKEISLIQFFSLDALPKTTWAVLPFMGRLKRWIAANRGKGKKSIKKILAKQNGRSTSVPRDRPDKKNTAQQPITMILKKDGKSSRATSTPNNHRNNTKSAGFKNKTERKHFGTEKFAGTCTDTYNEETFGLEDTSFSVDEMFKVNEQLTGQSFVYDGNPYDFGNQDIKKKAISASAPKMVASVAALFDAAAGNDTNGRDSRNKKKKSKRTFMNKKDNGMDANSAAGTRAKVDASSSSQVHSNSSIADKTMHDTSENTDDDQDGGVFTFDTMDIMACVT